MVYGACLSKIDLPLTCKQNDGTKMLVKEIITTKCYLTDKFRDWLTQARIIHSMADGVAPRFWFIVVDSSISMELWFCPAFETTPQNQFPITDSIRCEANINKTVQWRALQSKVIIIAVDVIIVNSISNIIIRIIMVMIWIGLRSFNDWNRHEYSQMFEIWSIGNQNCKIINK